MATIKTDLYCDLNKPVKVQYLGGNLFSLDNGGNTINVWVTEGGQPVQLGGTVSAEVIRADGETVPVSGAFSGNRAYVILPQACYVAPGPISIVIKNTEGTTVTTIGAAVSNVYRSSTDTVVDPGTIIPSVSALIAQINAAIGSIPADYSALLAAIATTYQSIAYPTVGTVVWHSGDLVKNKVPIATGETFDPDKWEPAVIGSYLATNSNNIQRIADTLGRATNITPALFERGYCYLTKATGELVTKSASTYYACTLIPVTEGDKITINGTGTSASDYRLYVFIDAEGKSMGRVAGGMTGERTIIAPAGAVYCAINIRIASQPDGYYAYKGTAVSDTLAETNNILNRATEYIPGGYLTPGMNETSNGVTRKTDGNVLTLYGTANATRRLMVFNGQNTIKVSTSDFAKTFDPGTYLFECSSAGAQLSLPITGTYTKFDASTFNVANPSSNPVALVTFTEPAMVGVTQTDGRDYGTEESPTTLTITITKLSAIDEVAREENHVNANAAAAAMTEALLKAPAIIESMSGTVASFDDGADMPFKSYYATIEPKQIGSGDPSPSNIREIKGFTKYNATVSGENLFGGEIMLKGVKASIPGATVNESAGTVSFAASAEVSDEYPLITDLCGMTGKFKEHTQYTFLLTLSKSSGADANLAVVYTNGTVSNITGVSGTGKTMIMFTSAGGTGTAAPTVLGLRKYNRNGTTTLYCNECSVVEGTSGYQRPYKGTMYEIAFPAEAGTVYGGSLQVKADGSGTLTVDRGMFVFDSAEKILSVTESSTGIMTMRSINFGNNAINGDETAISNQYSRAVSAAPASGTAIRLSIGDDGAIFVYDNRFSDLETAAAICEANPIQVCYALATPIVYNFTAGQIRSILGENHVWAESGNVSVQYAADTKLYIDAAIAAAINP